MQAGTRRDNLSARNYGVTDEFDILNSRNSHNDGHNDASSINNVLQERDEVS
jgi:hypothetical protein